MGFGIASDIILFYVISDNIVYNNVPDSLQSHLKEYLDEAHESWE